MRGGKKDVVVVIEALWVFRVCKGVGYVAMEISGRSREPIRWMLHRDKVLTGFRRLAAGMNVQGKVRV